MRRCRTLSRADLDGLRALEGPGGRAVRASGMGREWPSWVDAALAAWGGVGVGWFGAAGIESFILLAPGGTVPQGHPLAGTPRTPGAAVVVSSWVPGRRGGCSLVRGRFLVGRAAGWLDGAVPAIEAAGVATAGDPRCAPVSWLALMGFAEVQPVDVGPVRRMSLDLRRTVHDRRDVAARLVEWLGGRRLQGATRTQSPQQASREPLTCQ